jgi:Mitochondrial carrier protein
MIDLENTIPDPLTGRVPGVVATALAIVGENNGNYMALYRGFTMKLVRAIPASMIGFTVYEAVKRYTIHGNFL